MTTLQLGEIAIDRVVEMEKAPFVLPEFFHEATPDAVEPYRAWLEPDALDPKTGEMLLTVQSYLVRTRHHTILIDTCVGCRKSYDGIPTWQDRRDDTWLRNLAAAGVAPEDIDFVFCTHLHLDHAGWNTRLVDGRWVPTFPNAKYILARDEVAAAAELGHLDFQENVQPVLDAKQAVLVDTDYALDDQVWLEPTLGHTAGHVAIHLKSGSAHGVVTGDLIHSPLQLVQPDWSPHFDHDIVQSRTTRRRFLDTHCETDTKVMTIHFPLPSIGHVVRDKDVYGFDYV